MKPAPHARDPAVEVIREDRMYGRYATPLCVEPVVSRKLALLFAAALGGALVLPWLVPASPGVRAAAALLTAAVAVTGYRAAFGARRIVRAVWNEAGEWRLDLADGSELEAELMQGGLVTPEAMVLGFRAGRRRLHLVLLGDSLDPETRRRLRVRLRLADRKGRTTGDAARAGRG